jgi:hypothetical protein
MNASSKPDLPALVISWIAWPKSAIALSGWPMR